MEAPAVVFITVIKEGARGHRENKHGNAVDDSISNTAMIMVLVSRSETLAR